MDGSDRGNRAVAFCCSPRGERGATGLLLRTFLEGYHQGGGESTVLDPYRMNITPCRGCFHCWTMTPGECAIQDDMRGVLAELQQAGAVIFATPVYHFTMSEGMKRLLERTMPLSEPKVTMGPGGKATHARLGPHGQRTVLLSACGFPEPEVFSPLRATFSEVCRLMDWHLEGEVLRTMAGMLLSKDPMARESSGPYLKLVAEAGRRFAAGMPIDGEQRSRLERELLPIEEYLRLVNKWF